MALKAISNKKSSPSCARSTLKAIGFDFDGTLIMSEGKKAEMMATAFSESHELSLSQKKLIAKEYTKLVGEGYSRAAKVSVLFEKVLKRSGSLTERRKIALGFGSKYQESLNHCPLFACNKLVQELHGKIDHLFLLSLEDQKDVRAVAKHCQLSESFEIILGGPTGKVAHFKRLLKKWKLKPKEMLYIGDSHGDITVAKKVGIQVMLIDSKKGHKDLHQKLGVKVEVNSLCDVKSMIKQMIWKMNIKKNEA